MSIHDEVRGQWLLQDLALSEKASVETRQQKKGDKRSDNGSCVRKADPGSGLSFGELCHLSTGSLQLFLEGSRGTARRGRENEHWKTKKWRDTQMQGSKSKMFLRQRLNQLLTCIEDMSSDEEASEEVSRTLDEAFQLCGRFVPTDSFRSTHAPSYWFHIFEHL
ncbi:unnamed protein product [Tetraodon nigroviridis]|uniref:(spotted green pufferfish) hypothetical protein n=1 Tax=Tetraodon nigroviridis TaxID=99883 RepID=Q4SFU4_TETNG|nr:unnamed protein product [Tetraodon nigroviridis]